MAPTGAAIEIIVANFAKILFDSAFADHHLGRNTYRVALVLASLYAEANGLSCQGLVKCTSSALRSVTSSLLVLRLRLAGSSR